MPGTSSASVISHSFRYRYWLRLRRVVIYPIDVSFGVLRMNYKETLNLPKTEFPMKANLTSREPEILARWDAENIYAQIQEVRRDDPLFVLHDGPPFANGDVHMGTALNKILKDLIVK